MTYSINIGTNIQSTTYNIMGATSIDLSDVLLPLHDNTNKEISPEDIRNSILTSWSNTSFKETIGSALISYIGIDSGNPIDRDIKDKIFLGKRSYSGTYSYLLSDDIMNSDILNRSEDIFLFNTKKDTVSNSKTRISILSGTNSNLYLNAPYIQSQVINNGTNDTNSLDIVNEIGDINIKSVYGTTSINTIEFPKIEDSVLYDLNDKVLIMKDDVMIWNSLSFSSIEYIGTTGSKLDINGETVNVNGYSIEFTDDRPCPFEIGDIKFGDKFDSVSISDMLRRMIYDYSPPECEISLRYPYTSGYVEVGTSPIIKLDYKIYKRTLPTETTILHNMIPSIYQPITNSNEIIISGSATGVVITPITPSTTLFSINVSDGTQSSLATSSITGLYPYFYGFNSFDIISTSGLLSLNKLIEPVGNKSIDIYGTGNLYFIYDSNYPVLSNIYDETGSTVSNNFTYSLVTLSSPTGLWASKQFRVYQWNNHTISGPPSVIYDFKY